MRLMARLYLLLLFGVGSLVFGAPVYAQQATVDKSVATADAEAGKRYALRCKACHTLDKGGANRLGPNLWNIVGRKKSSVAKFNYSPAFRKLEGVWSLEQLDGFMSDPRKFVPQTRMVFPGIKNASQRHNLLAYLATLSDTPPRSKSVAGKAATAAGAPSMADELNLPQGAGREDVAAICAACHSLSIVRQQGLDEDRWDELMTWMTEKQGMPELEAQQRKNVVSYLAKHFGPQSRQSRPNAMNPMMPSMPSMPLPMPK
jgi:cytochrome c